MADDERAERLAEQNRIKPNPSGHYNDKNPNNHPVRTIQLSEISDCTSSTQNSARSETPNYFPSDGKISINSSPQTLTKKKSGRKVSFSQSLGASKIQYPIHPMYKSEINHNHDQNQNQNQNEIPQYCYPDEFHDYPGPRTSQYKRDSDQSPPPQYSQQKYLNKPSTNNRPTTYSNMVYGHSNDEKLNNTYSSDLSSTCSSAYSSADESYATPQQKNRRAISSFVEGTSIRVNNF